MPGTRFIAFKVPLKKSFDQNLLPEERFSPRDLIRRVEEQQEELGLVIDLTCTTRYYGREELPPTLRYSKILTMGHKIPNRKTILRFKYLVKRFLSHNKDNDKLIGVHCTHGLNRTGYLVCRYLIDVEGMEPNAAIELFNKSRGHPIERSNYIQDLQKRALKSCEVKNSGSDLTRRKGSAPGRPQKQLVKHHPSQAPLAVPRNPKKKQQQAEPRAQGQPQELGNRHRALGLGHMEQGQFEKLEQGQLEEKKLERRQQRKQEQKQQNHLEQRQQKNLKHLEQKQQRQLEKQNHLEQNYLEQRQQKKLKYLEQNHLDQNHLEQKQQRQQNYLEQKQQHHPEQRQQKRLKHLEQNHLEQKQQRQLEKQNHLGQKQQKKLKHLEQNHVGQKQNHLEQNHLDQDHLEQKQQRQQKKLKHLEQSQQNHLEQRQPCSLAPRNCWLSPAPKKQHKELFPPQSPQAWLLQEPKRARKRRHRRHGLQEQEMS